MTSPRKPSSATEYAGSTSRRHGTTVDLRRGTGDSAENGTEEAMEREAWLDMGRGGCKAKGKEPEPQRNPWPATPGKPIQLSDRVSGEAEGGKGGEKREEPRDVGGKDKERQRKEICVKR
ncbi:hypothetical protein MMC13_006828 [Lambiella insularis]|nr:hypothetical protein [Lambiella insularis]